MKLDQLDTPSLLIDRERLLKNLADMQRYADELRRGSSARTPKRTKCPAIAKLQLAAGRLRRRCWQRPARRRSWRKTACTISLSPMRSSASRSCGASPTLAAARRDDLLRRGHALSGGRRPSSVFAAAERPRPGPHRDRGRGEPLRHHRGSGFPSASGYHHTLPARCRSAASSPTTATATVRGGSSRRSTRSVRGRAADGRCTLPTLAAAHGMPCQTVSYGATPTFMNHVNHPPRHHRASPRHLRADGRLAGPRHRHAGPLRGDRAGDASSASPLPRAPFWTSARRG